MDYTMSATDDDTEVTKTGIVRKRNENGYIMHPDREDTGTTDRHIAFAFIGGALLSVASTIVSLVLLQLDGVELT